VFPDTRQLLNKERIGQIKEGAVLINCARGELVEEPALVEALKSGHLSGAGLDCVAEERPGGGNAYLDFENVVLSPHVAGVSIENFGSMMQRGFDNAEAYLSGEPLPPGDVIWLPEQRR
jgi:phosphoglycerate dehydrogenase-like enzyme